MQVGLEQGTQNQSYDQADPGPAVLLEIVPHHAQQEGDRHIQETSPVEIGAQGGNREDQRGEPVQTHDRQPGEGLDQQHPDDRGQPVGEKQGPDQDEGQRQILGHQLGPGHNPVKGKDSEEQSRPLTPGYAEGQGGHQRSPVLGIVGGLGREHAADVTLAEPVTALPGGLGGMTVGDETGNRAADTGNDTDQNTDDGASHEQPEVPENRLNTLTDST